MYSERPQYGAIRASHFFPDRLDFRFPFGFLIRARDAFCAISFRRSGERAAFRASAPRLPMAASCSLERDRARASPPRRPNAWAAIRISALSLGLAFAMQRW